MTISISRGNTKTGRIPAFSLPPVTTCPGACDGCRSACYALKSFRQYPGVRRAWTGNLEASKVDGFVPEMIKRINKTKGRFFRIHVSGDFYSTGYWNKWLEICHSCPDKRFLAFSKSPAAIRKPLGIGPDYMQIPANLTVVESVWLDGLSDIAIERLVVKLDGKPFPVALTITKGSEPPKGSILCPGNCETCGMCWGLEAGQAVALELH